MTKQIQNLKTGDRYELPIGKIEIIGVDADHGRRFHALLNGEQTYVAFSAKTVEVK